MRRDFGWAGTVHEFLAMPLDAWQNWLSQHHEGLFLQRPAGTQLLAWEAEHHTMQTAFESIGEVALEWGVVFEFELPLEGGRRPDVVVLAGQRIHVLEFKSAPHPLQADVDQVVAYARDLGDYHEASHGLEISPLLVLPNSPNLAALRDGVQLVGPDRLAEVLETDGPTRQIVLDDWLRAPYAPLPTLVEAARRLFNEEPLPHVKAALSAGIPETIAYIQAVTDEARRDGSKQLVLLSGVPGSGKTLVGLRVVYEHKEAAEQATFLSGNGPLVAVLQDALRSSVFVRDLHAFVRTYGLADRIPKDRVVVFDEAQRAWDRRFMLEKRGVNRSEPEILLDIANRQPDYTVLVGLVGEGQAIHSGEEGGMEEWRKALSNSLVPWVVHCPEHLAEQLQGVEAKTSARLDLTISLRSRRAEELHAWVAHLLAGSLELARKRAQGIRAQAYPIYVTDDLERAKTYVRARYEGEPDKRYGLVASSHAKVLKRFDVRNDYMATSRMNIAKWFNAGAEEPASGLQLSQPITEFQCQGLELDLPIVCWGDDFRWEEQAWRVTPVRRRYPLEDPVQIVQNVYRVLLTRGRDGVVIWVPPTTEMGPTLGAMLQAGAVKLPNGEALAVQADEAAAGS